MLDNLETFSFILVNFALVFLLVTVAINYRKGRK